MEKCVGPILLFLGIKPQNGKHKNTRSIIGNHYMESSIELGLVTDQN